MTAQLLPLSDLVRASEVSCSGASNIVSIEDRGSEVDGVINIKKENNTMNIIEHKPYKSFGIFTESNF